MPTPTFPSGLPKMLMRNYVITPGNNLLRTDMDVGPARVRRRFISMPSEVQVQWLLSRTDLQTFETFYRTDLYDGAAWFNINIVNGSGDVSRLARFKEPYTASAEAKDHMWSVSATLEVVFS